jgi:putative Mn2+ efflux pump MntP
MMEHDINFISAVLVLISSAVPIYFITKLKDELKVLSAILVAFLLSHAAYHLLYIFGFEFVGEKVEPISVVVLIIFGAAYLWTRKRQEVKA